MLGATPHQVYGEFDQGAREAAAKKGTGETAWAGTRCLVGGHHELDEPGIDADMLVPLQDQQQQQQQQHVWMSACLFSE